MSINPKPPTIKAIEIHEFLSLMLPPREMILEPWLPSQGIAMIYAARGIGKTFISMFIAYAVACGEKFMNWTAPNPRGVLYLDGEMPAKVLQERQANIALSCDKEPSAPFILITPDLQEMGMIDLSRKEDQEALEPFLEDISLIVVDNLSTLCRTGRENEGESWLPVQEWALRQRSSGRTVLFVHHAGKSGQQRGASRREDVMDTVISLKRPADYTPDKGATFEVHFEKARGLMGDETKPFEATLTTTKEGNFEWITKSLEESTAEKVASLLNDGVLQHEIAEMLGLAKGTISKAKKKALAQGLIQ